MITLYRIADCAACDEVETALRELVVAHKVVDVTQVEAAVATNGIVKGAGGTAKLDRPWPMVVDGDRVVSGQVALQEYLGELARELEQWRKYQTDACYVDDQGKSC